MTDAQPLTRSTLTARGCRFVWACLALLQMAYALADQASVSVEPAALVAQRVLDQTETLSSEVRQRLVQKLTALEQRRGAQIAVVVVASTGGSSIDEFANQTFRAWELGRKGANDGVLVLVAKQDRAVRIEVGYGLEGAITDLLAGQIIRERMVPAFRQGDFAGGIEAAVADLIVLVEGEALPATEAEPLSPAFYAGLLACVIGALAGVLLSGKPARWRWILPTLAALMVVLAFALGGSHWRILLIVMPICMVFSGIIFAALSMIKAVLYSVLGVIVYVSALVLISQRMGGTVFFFGMAALVFAGLAALLYWLVVKTWRQGRQGFYIRAGVTCVIWLALSLMGFSASDTQTWWALMPCAVFAALLVFGFDKASKGGRSTSGSSASRSTGGSGSGSGFSGGGGSSGGGGASGKW
jgi:uncharacterized protein